MSEGKERARRARRDVTSAAVLANAVGAAAVFVFLTWLSYGTGFSDRGARISAAIAAPYGVVATAWSYWRGGRLFARAIEWLATGREPTPEERAATLAQPGRLAVLFFEPWAGAALLYGVLNAAVFHPSVVRSLQVAATTLLGGLTTCMVFFLVVERRLRPVFAVALLGTPPPRPATIGIRPGWCCRGRSDPGWC